MADNISLIGSDGGDDYSTITAWEADTDNVLANREIGECRSENFAESVEIAGATVDQDNYRWLRSMTGHEFDHTDETGARMVLTGSAVTYCLKVTENYVRIGGSESTSIGSIGFKLQTTASAAAGSIMTSYGKTGLVFHEIVTYECENTTNAIAGILNLGADLAMFNCLIHTIINDDSGFKTRGLRGYDGTTFCYNCVVYRVENNVDDEGIGFSCESGSVYCYNCYSGACVGFTGKDYQSNILGDYNASSDTTSSIFTHNLQSKAGANQFTSVVVDSEDFHLKDGSDLIDAGDDSYSNEWDIDGPVAGARDDIGVDEYEGEEEYDPAMLEWNFQAIYPQVFGELRKECPFRE